MDRYTLETSRPKFYAGGDVVTGASNVSNAMAYGKEAARKIDLQLMEADRFARALPGVSNTDQTPPEEPSPSPRHSGIRSTASGAREDPKPRWSQD